MTAAAARRIDKRVGYARVSSITQNGARQLDGVDLDKIFTDKLSGKDTKRPQLQACLEYLREGDQLIVHSMDRLARNVEDLRRTVRTLNEKGVSVQFVKENLTFTGEDSPMANLLLSMLGAVAEFERSLIRERQLEGIAIAKKAGVYKGRKPTLTPEQAASLKLRAKTEKKSALAREFGISRETVYQYLAAAAPARSATRPLP
jgi:DNA invertase Pin-like site-specific DNA recombinase